MDTIFQKINNLIESSILTPAEKNQFLMALSVASNEDLGALVSVFEDNPEWIIKIYENYKMKLLANENKSLSGWEQILKDEEIILNSLNSD